MFEAMAPHMKFPMGFVFSHLGMFERLLIKLIPKLNTAAVVKRYDSKVASRQKRTRGTLCTREYSPPRCLTA